MAKILVIGDRYYRKEGVLETEPFSQSNTYLTRNIAKQAGIKESDIVYKNVFPDTYKVKRVFRRGQPAQYWEQDETYQHAKKTVKDMIKEVQPNVVIVLNSLQLYILTGEWQLGTFRGTLMQSETFPKLKIIPSLHPTALHKEYLKLLPCIYDFKKALKYKDVESFPEDTRQLTVSPPPQEFMDFCDYLITAPPVTEIAFDIETQQPGTHISWVGFSASPEMAMSLKMLSNRMPRFSTRVEVRLWEKIAQVLTCGKPIIAQNGIYDMSVMWLHHNIYAPLAFDTHIAAHVLWPQLPRSLGFLSSFLLDVRAWKHTSEEDMGQYNAEDVANTHGLYYELDKRIDSEGVRDIFEMEMRQTEISAFLGLNGLTVDTGVRAKLQEDCERDLDEVERQLLRIAKKPYNWNSDKQMIGLLYDELGYKKKYNIAKNGKKKGQRVLTVDNEALNKLLGENEDKDNEIIHLLLKHRKLSKMYSGFLTDELEEGTNKIYTSFNIAGTGEGRWSSSGSIIKPFGSGNIQNIPYVARKMYVPNDIIIGE